jgi:hypothetical protein
MKFSNRDGKITDSALNECEMALELTFPKPLRECYLFANGGEPTPYVFENEELDTVVSEFIPIISANRGTAMASYYRIVKSKRIVPLNFFPFARDGGGDYFFVDTNAKEGTVFFYRSDSNSSRKLLDLKMGIMSFWESLKAE